MDGCPHWRRAAEPRGAACGGLYQRTIYKDRQGNPSGLVWSAADFENFLQPRPTLASDMDKELERITRPLVEQRWPFRIHATYDESIARFLDIFEKVDKDIPFDGLRFIIDHAETIRPASIDRIKALGGGIAIQHRMAFQGEYFVERYGATEAAWCTRRLSV